MHRFCGVRDTVQGLYALQAVENRSVFLIGGFTADIFILRDFLLDLKPMCFEMIVMTGILMGATVLIEALSSFFERHITDNLLAFQRYWKDVFVKMSAKRKAGKENKNA